MKLQGTVERQIYTFLNNQGEYCVLIGSTHHWDAVHFPQIKL